MSLSGSESGSDNGSSSSDTDIEKGSEGGLDSEEILSFLDGGSGASLDPSEIVPGSGSGEIGSEDEFSDDSDENSGSVQDETGSDEDSDADTTLQEGDETSIRVDENSLNISGFGGSPISGLGEDFLNFNGVEGLSEALPEGEFGHAQTNLPVNSVNSFDILDFDNLSDNLSGMLDTGDVKAPLHVPQKTQAFPTREDEKEMRRVLDAVICDRIMALFARIDDKL